MKPEADSTVRRERLEACLEDAKVLWDYHAVGQPIAAADVLVCLGSYDSRVAVRSAQMLRETGLVRLIEELVGDLQRLQEYPAAGFQIPMQIPGTVLQAYGRLRAAGSEGHGLR